MADPLGFYKKHGLDVEVIKTAGWAVIRDKTINKEYDAAHMLAPMPLAITMGVGSNPIPYTMPAVENINGQAITLAMKHKDKRNPKDWKGFKFGVPFDFSMHNYLLRYYLAENGLDPDRDVQIRSVPPPEMVANLRADNIDGFLGPDPFNQRAVFDGVGFIHLLTKELWDGHPCCAFAASREFMTTMPNTYAALLKAIIDATAFAAKQENRKQIAEAIAPANYLNQPQVVLEQILTGTYADGLGQVKKDPNRIQFDPFPWESFAVWILTQMKRWGQIKGDIDYNGIARQVFLATDTTKLMKEVGLVPPTTHEQDVRRDGQDVRSGQARRLHQQLRDQEAVSQSCKPHSTCGRRCFRCCCSQVSCSPGMWACREPRPSSRWTRNTPASWASRATQGKSAMPGPLDVGAQIWSHLKDPFYDKGPNDKGLGIQLAYSVGRVLLGYFLAVLVALPIGFLIGMSPLMSRALDPFIQVMKPISPLAWMPLALYTIKDFGHLRDLRDLHLLDLAHAAQHGVRRLRHPQGMAQRRPHARSLADPQGVHDHPAGRRADDRDRHAHLHRHRVARHRRRRDARGRHRHRLLRLERVEQPLHHQRDHGHLRHRRHRDASRPDPRLCRPPGHLSGMIP